MKAKTIIGISAITVLSSAAIAITNREAGDLAVPPSGAASAVQQQLLTCIPQGDLASADHTDVAPQSGLNSCHRHGVVGFNDLGRAKLSFRWR